MSTLSTLESFVQLPGGNHFSWGLASVLGGAGGRNETAPNANATVPHKQTSDSVGAAAQQSVNAALASTGATTAEDPAKVAASNFLQALTMIAYNSAFVARTQGVAVDLHEAAGSTLRLLSRAVTSPELGR